MSSFNKESRCVLVNQLASLTVNLTFLDGCVVGGLPTVVRDDIVRWLMGATSANVRTVDGDRWVWGWA